MRKQLSRRGFVSGIAASLWTWAACTLPTKAVAQAETLAGLERDARQAVHPVSASGVLVTAYDCSEPAGISFRYSSIACYDSFGRCLMKPAGNSHGRVDSVRVSLAAQPAEVPSTAGWHL